MSAIHLSSEDVDMAHGDLEAQLVPLGLIPGLMFRNGKESGGGGDVGRSLLTPRHWARIWGMGKILCQDTTVH